MNNSEAFYARLHRPSGDLSLPIRRQDVLRDVKWKVFLKRAKRFRHVPFADFALAAGSMALGNVKSSSDFDVIVCCGHGRIFTARLFATLLFGFFGERRAHLHPVRNSPPLGPVGAQSAGAISNGVHGTGEHDHIETANMICFNHFVTQKCYRLSPPHNVYWAELYRSLVPLWGNGEKIGEFFAANDWAGKPYVSVHDRRYVGSGHSLFGAVFEYLLSGRLGDKCESILRILQLRRIKKNLKKDAHGFEPRIRYGDDELEFHPDTRRIAELVKGLE